MQIAIVLHPGRTAPDAIGPVMADAEALGRNVAAKPSGVRALATGAWRGLTTYREGRGVS